MASARNAKLTRIQRRERLEKLFDKGRYLYFTADDTGNVITRDKGAEQEDDLRIWVRPSSPLQREMAIREAQAGRARATVSARTEGSNDWSTIKSYVMSLSMDELVSFVLDLDDDERLQEARRDVLKQDEWKDFNELRDAMRQWEEAGAPRNDPEWEPLLQRDRDFGTQVVDRHDELRDDSREALKMMDRSVLQDRAFDRRVDQVGTAAFMRDYETWMLYYACRDDEDHNELYFETIDELKSQPQELQEALSTTLNGFVQEASEAKNLPAAESSSDLSAPPAEPEISESSTPVASNA